MGVLSIALLSFSQHRVLCTLQIQARASDNDDDDDDDAHNYDKRKTESVSATPFSAEPSAVTSRLSALKARLEADRSRDAASPEDDRCDVLCMHASTFACKEIRPVGVVFLLRIAKWEPT